MSRRAAGTNRWLIPTLALFVVLPIAGAVVQAVRGDGDTVTAVEAARADRAGSTSLGRSPAPLLPEEAPASYEIAYLVIDTSTERISYSNDEVRVRRPFDARVTTRDGRVPGKGAVRGERVSVLTRLALRGAKNTWTTFEIPPALATSDVRFAAALDQAIADGEIAVRERRNVRGRECQVFRAGSSLQAGVLTPYRPGAPTFADVCVDREGLVLEEVWTIDNKRVQRRVAVEVDTDVTIDDDDFTIPSDAQTMTAAQGGGSAQRLDPAARPPGLFRALPGDAVPDGFEHLGRWAVISPRLDVMRDPTEPEESSNAASTVDVYVRGADVLVIDQGAVTAAGALPSAEASRPVDLGPLSVGEAITDFRMNEVRAQFGRDFVRVYGTLPIPMLVETARALRIVPADAP